MGYGMKGTIIIKLSIPVTFSLLSVRTRRWGRRMKWAKRIHPNKIRGGRRDRVVGSWRVKRFDVSPSSYYLSRSQETSSISQLITAITVLVFYVFFSNQYWRNGRSRLSVWGRRQKELWNMSLKVIFIFIHPMLSTVPSSKAVGLFASLYLSSNIHPFVPLMQRSVRFTGQTSQPNSHLLPVLIVIKILNLYQSN